MTNGGVVQSEQQQHRRGRWPGDGEGTGHELELARACVRVVGSGMCVVCVIVG